MPHRKGRTTPADEQINALVERARSAWSHEVQYWTKHFGVTTAHSRYRRYLIHSCHAARSK